MTGEEPWKGSESWCTVSAEIRRKSFVLCALLSSVIDLILTPP